MFDAPRKEKGIDRTAPTRVPRKAIATVSNSRYGTPFVFRFSSRDGVGCRIPCTIPFATEKPEPPVEFDCTALLDQSSRTRQTSMIRSWLTQVLGALARAVS